MTVTVPYTWIKRAPPSLLEDDQIPLFGYPPEFPWNEFSTILAKRFEIEDLTIKFKTTEWQNHDTYKNLVENSVVVNFIVNPLPGLVSWIFPSNVVNNFVLQILPHDQQVTQIESEYVDGIYTYVLLEAMQAFTQVPFDKALSPQIVKEPELSDQDALVLEVEVSISDKVFDGHLLISEEFIKAWKERYAVRQLNAQLSSKIAGKLDVIVSIEAGRTSLTLDEWKNIQVGDFLTLDSCSLKGESEGRVLLTVNGENFFRARIKNGKIKILEHPLYHEVTSTMSTNIPGNNSEHMLEGEDDNASLFEGDEDDGYEDEQPSQVQEPVEEQQQESLPATAVSETKMIKPEEITLPVVVEVGRLQINVQKLMELQPGNILDLDIHPENGVDLVVNGNRIAKGELLLIGDVLGVRVLDIG